MALIEKLSAIGAAIREKNGTEELLTLEQMAIAISEIQSGGGEGIVYTRISSNTDGSITLTDVEENKHMLIPTVDENGTITAIEFDGETIELTYDDNGALIAFGDTTTDFSNVIVDEEAEASSDYIVINHKGNFSGNEVYYSLDNEYFPMTDGKVLKFDFEILEGSSFRSSASVKITLSGHDSEYNDLTCSATPFTWTNPQYSTIEYSTEGVQTCSCTFGTYKGATFGRLALTVSFTNSGAGVVKARISNVRVEGATA